VFAAQTASKTFPATVKTINPAGPQVKVELVAEMGRHGASRNQPRALPDAAPGNRRAHVFLKPKEQKLFVYQI